MTLTTRVLWIVLIKCKKEGSLGDVDVPENWLINTQYILDFESTIKSTNNTEN
jgi:hypothetical protein